MQLIIPNQENAFSLSRTQSNFLSTVRNSAQEQATGVKCEPSQPEDYEN